MRAGGTEPLTVAAVVQVAPAGGCLDAQRSQCDLSTQRRSRQSRELRCLEQLAPLGARGPGSFGNR